MTETSINSPEWRKKVAETAVWGNPPGQFLTRQAIQVRVEKILERIAKKVSTNSHEQLAEK